MQATKAIAPPDNTPAKQGKIDIGEALRMYLAENKTYQQIGEHFGVAKQSVHERLKPIIALTEPQSDYAAYRNNRALLFDGAVLKLLKELLTSGKIKKANMGEISTSIERLYKLMRLENNQSTENIAETVKVVPSDAVDRLDRILNGNSDND